ncbi:hypothetical protein IGS61_05940 [Janthinobacterium sp. FW305-129]|uniref:hypothetical protein n=1 Tax=Janthinobacterium sp. FW305-129 TaxID=2775054 RepID=UPI001E4CA9BD|nr:hypothetical protein [Janthinobacterium sp. FW305-129]MCC7597017.1 hypothetical protein [Janthinobacterium sp. FW305-129]
MNKQKGKPTVRRKRMFCSYGLARMAMQARQQDWRSAFFDHWLDKNHAPIKKGIFKVVYLHFDIPRRNKIRLRRARNSPLCPSRNTGFYLYAGQMADNDVLAY